MNVKAPAGASGTSATRANTCSNVAGVRMRCLTVGSKAKDRGRETLGRAVLVRMYYLLSVSGELAEHTVNK